MAASYGYDTGNNRQRTVVLFAIIGLHALLVYAFASGLAFRVIELVALPIDASLLDKKALKVDAPPPPQVEMERPEVQIVAPDINIPVFVDAPAPITYVAPKPPPPPPPPGTKLARVSGPSTEDYYPSISRTAGEEGRPLIKVCVDANNRLESVEVGESSGFTRLDEAAVKLAKASRFKAATEAGKAVATCANLPIRFELTKK